MMNRRTVENFSKFEVSLCADSFNEWLYFFFRESAEHDRQYVKRLDDYFAAIARK
jgi:hypothetical protein